MSEPVTTLSGAAGPAPGTGASGLTVLPHRDQHRELFVRLQQRLEPLWRELESAPDSPHTVLVLPGISLDHELLVRIDGLRCYEERLLTMLMLLRKPRLRLVYVTSTPIEPLVIDYYLNFLEGVPHGHARRRLVLLSPYDASPIPLTEKVLMRPRLMARIRDALVDPSRAYMACFNATELERELALQLDIPLYATDPELGHLGSKSGSRMLFREAGVPLPHGSENLKSRQDMLRALVALRQAQPGTRRAAVKLDEGASGEGNATFDFSGAPDESPEALSQWIDARLEATLQFEAEHLDWPAFERKWQAMGGVVEAWVEGRQKRSPSVQMRITPNHQLMMISTHDQILGGRSGQVYLGCLFPADEAYRSQILAQARRIGEALRDRGVIGRFSVDFIASRNEDEEPWRLDAIEINLRKGGTTHTFQTLLYLTNGRHDEHSGDFELPTGPTRVYYATDNLQSPAYRRLTPEDLIDISVEHGLLFDQTRQEGVTFNLIGALAEFGKLGIVSIASSPERAEAQYRRTVDVLDAATQ